jgi:sec-independent protein translocase protein TatC
VPGRTRRSRETRKLTIGEHLRELRRRAFIAALAVLAGAVIGWFANDLVWAELRRPIETVVSRYAQNATINYSTIFGAFDLRVSVAVTLGIIVSSPVWLYQLFAFLVPGLTVRERRYVIGFVGAAVPLFVVGGIAGWLVVPHIVELMLGFVPRESASFVEAREYLAFVLKLIVATGVAFVLPVLLVMLNFLGMLAGSTIVRSWRWAILGTTAFAAIATPAADVMSMFLLAVPILGLYFIAAAIAMIRDRRIRGALEASASHSASIAG